jgi:hypothetical protein
MHPIVAAKNQLPINAARASAGSASKPQSGVDTSIKLSQVSD